MTDAGVETLLIGESERSFSHIAKRLERAGCHCHYANSYEEAAERIDAGSFDMVLSVIRSQERVMASVVDRLAAAGGTFYYAHPVEDSCWWLPLIRRGELCFGRPALRPSEFAGVLEEAVAEIRAEKSGEPDPVISVVVVQGRPQVREAGEPALRAHSKAAS